MITTNALLETGSRAVNAFQTALATTSHNITNAQTEGYTRQRANLQATPAFAGTPGMVGTGVEVGTVLRMRSSVLDTNIRNQQGAVERYDRLSTSMDTMQGILGDATNGSISQGLDKFFNAWQELSANPEGLPSRQVVVANAAQLADTFRTASARLDDLNTSLNQDFQLDINTANSYTQQIGQLNSQISLLEFQNQSANDLRDKRDVLIDNLSKMMNIHVVENANNMVDIDVGGNYLVQGISHTDITGVVNANNHMEAWLGAVQLPITTGKFQGNADSYTNLDTMRSQLNTLAAGLVNQVNALHVTGYDMNNNLGGNFFTATVGNEAATIDVSAPIANDPSLVASSGAPNAPGNNAISLALSQLRDTKVIPGAGPLYTLSQAYNNLTIAVGTTTETAMAQHDDFTKILDATKAQSQSFSGVNTDEELTNMISYQRSYQAAARVITTVDDVMDRIINHMGRVGLA